MSNGLATRHSNGVTPTEEASALEAVIANGDIAKLTPQQRVAYYRARCDSLGLDPLSQPFQYITLQGKLTLYATKACTDQLRATRGVSVVRLTPSNVGDVYCVVCDVRDATGRTDSATGAVTIAGLKGDALANALMKAETKSKRRATLSICGLGMLDESEIETIRDAQRVSAEQAHALPPPVNNNTTHGRGQYASPDDVQAYETAVKSLCNHYNERFADRVTNLSGGDLPNVRVPCEFWRMNWHLAKWAHRMKFLNLPMVYDDESDTEKPDIKPGNVSKYVAIVYHRQRAEMKTEAIRYHAECCDEELRRLGLIQDEPGASADDDALVPEVIDDFDRKIAAGEV